MTQRIITIAALLVTLSFSTFSQDKYDKIKRLIDSVHHVYPEMGISIGLVTPEGELSYQKGNRDRKNLNSAVNTETVFELASITKALTGNLLAQAVNEDKVKLDDYIDGYLPSRYRLKPSIANKVKVSDLASHQSGLVDVDFGALIAANPQQPTAAIGPLELAKMLNSQDTLIDYGQYRYSTLGLAFTGQILEEVYRVSYRELVTQKLIKPLNLERTFTKDFPVENVSKSYNMNEGEQELFLWSCVAPAGLIKTSTSDMQDYLRAVLDTTSQIGKAALLQEQSFYKDDKREIGLAQNIIKVEGKVFYAKTGDTLGQSSLMCYNREDGWGVVVFMNRNNSGLRNELFNTISEIMTF